MFHNVKNNAESVLSSSVDVSQTSIAVVGDNFPVAPFYLTIDNEILEVTAKNNNVFTVVRAVDGTIASPHAQGAAVEHYIVADLFRELQSSITNISLTPGPRGPQGIQGLKGDTGLQGPIGLTGPQGIKGDTGAEGPQGPIGLTGATGPKGDKGDTGLQGPQGIQGLTGPKGDTGLQGIQGVKGDTGATGADGAKGDKGDPGDSAYQVWLNVGNTGTIVDFVNSLKGATGAQGIQGPKGDIGAAPDTSLYALKTDIPAPYNDSAVVTQINALQDQLNGVNTAMTTLVANTQ